MSSRHRRNFNVSGFSFCRESFSIFRKVFFLPRVFFFCREVFLFFFSKVVYTRVEQESWKLLLKNDMIFYRVPIAMQNSFKSFLGWRVNDPIQLSVERWTSHIIVTKSCLKSDVLQPSNVTFVTVLHSYELLATPA